MVVLKRCMKNSEEKFERLPRGGLKEHLEPVKGRLSSRCEMGLLDPLVGVSTTIGGPSEVLLVPRKERSFEKICSADPSTKCAVLGKFRFC